jgi:hypothetical protein
VMLEHPDALGKHLHWLVRRRFGRLNRESYRVFPNEFE